MCRTVTAIPAQLPKNTPSIHLPTVTHTSSPSLHIPQPQHDQSNPIMAFKPPITLLTANRRSVAVENDLMLHIVLDDIAAWGPEQIEKVLRRCFNQHNWVASVFDEYKYLIKGPNKGWVDSVSARGYLRLENVQFPVMAWDRNFGEGREMDEVWVRIYGYPMYFNDWVEYERILNPFGAFVLEVAPGTHSGYDTRFVRLRLAVCDVNLLPTKHHVPYRNAAGFLSCYDLDIEIETPTTESLQAWRDRIQGRPYPNGTSFRQQPGWPPQGAHPGGGGGPGPASGGGGPGNGGPGHHQAASTPVYRRRYRPQPAVTNTARASSSGTQIHTHPETGQVLPNPHSPNQGILHNSASIDKGKAPLDQDADPVGDIPQMTDGSDLAGWEQQMFDAAQFFGKSGTDIGGPSSITRHQPLPANATTSTESVLATSTALVVFHPELQIPGKEDELFQDTQSGFSDEEAEPDSHTFSTLPKVSESEAADDSLRAKLQNPFPNSKTFCLQSLLCLTSYSCYSPH